MQHIMSLAQTHATLCRMNTDERLSKEKIDIYDAAIFPFMQLARPKAKNGVIRAPYNQSLFCEGPCIRIV